MYEIECFIHTYTHLHSWVHGSVNNSRWVTVSVLQIVEWLYSGIIFCMCCTSLYIAWITCVIRICPFGILAPEYCRTWLLRASSLQVPIALMAFILFPDFSTCIDIPIHQIILLCLYIADYVISMYNYDIWYVHVQYCDCLLASIHNIL